MVTFRYSFIKLPTSFQGKKCETHTLKGSVVCQLSGKIQEHVVNTECYLWENSLKIKNNVLYISSLIYIYMYQLGTIVLR